MQRLILPALLLASLSAVAFGQASAINGEIVGTVTDSAGSAIANIASFPFEAPRLLRLPLRGFINAGLRRYRRDYQRRHRLDDDAVRYFQVFRAMAQLLAVRRKLADGEQGGGAFHSEAGMRNLSARIHALNGIALPARG